MRTLLAIAICVFAMAGASALPIAAEPLIQPGAQLASGCAVGFVFNSYARTGPHIGAIWFTTARNCVGGVNTPVELGVRPGIAIGQVAYVSVGGPQGGQFALIEVGAPFHGDVSGALRGVPDLPQQTFTQEHEVFTGDPLPMARAPPLDLIGTPELRRAVVLEEAGYGLSVAGVFLASDLGGPLVHEWTGHAFGIITVSEPGEARGQTVEGLVADLLDAGFPVELRTA